VKRVIVSTDDEEIAEVSELYGAQVIRRPAELARDETPTIDVVLHVLDVLSKDHYQPEVVVLLQPTSPLRLAKDIDDAIHLFLNSECESVVSVCEAKHPPFWSLSIEGGYLKPFFREEFLRRRKQELPKLYVPNGAIYISSPQALYKYRSFYTPKTMPFIMPISRSIDIDEEEDLILAEQLMKNLHCLTHKDHLEGVNRERNEGEDRK